MDGGAAWVIRTSGCRSAISPQPHPCVVARSGIGRSRLDPRAGAIGMNEFLSRWWDMLISQGHGPLAFRFILQPTVAALLAICAGIRDARARRPAHGWAIITDRVHRRELLRESWHDVARLFAV